MNHNTEPAEATLLDLLELEGADVGLFAQLAKESIDLKNKDAWAYICARTTGRNATFVWNIRKVMKRKIKEAKLAKESP